VRRDEERVTCELRPCRVPTHMKGHPGPCQGGLLFTGELPCDPTNRCESVKSVDLLHQNHPPRRRELTRRQPIEVHAAGYI